MPTAAKWANSGEGIDFAIKVRLFFRSDNVKRAFLLWAIDFLVLFVSYQLFVMNEHFNSDTYHRYLSGFICPSDIVLGQWEHGRITASFFDWVVVECLGISLVSKKLLLVMNLLYLGMCSAMTTMATIFCSRAIANASMRFLMISNFSVMLLFINPCIVAGSLSFPETLPEICGGFALTLAAFFLWARKRFISSAIAFVCLSLALNGYGIYLEFFFPLGLVYLLVCNDFAFNKRTAIDVIRFILFVGLASVLALAMSKAFTFFMDVPLTSSSVATLNLATIGANFVAIISAQPEIWYSMDGISFKMLFPCILAVPLVLSIIIKRVDRNRREGSFLVLFLGCIALWLSAFAPAMLETRLWLPARVYVGIWSIPFLLYVFLARAIYCANAEGDEKAKKTDSTRIVNVAVGLLTLSVVACSINVTQIQSSTLVINAAEKDYANTLNQVIKNYEKETGKEVKKVLYHADGSPSGWTTKYHGKDLNWPSVYIKWGFPGLYKYATGDVLEIEPMDEDTYNNLFKGKNWDAINMEEQAVFEDAILYLAIH